MKNTMKKILCIALIVIMCLTSVPLGDFMGIKFKADAVNSVSDNRYFGNRLTGIEKEVYNKFVEHYIENKKYSSCFIDLLGRADTPAKLDKSTLQFVGEPFVYFNSFITSMCSVIDAFIYDYPELFWLRSFKIGAISSYMTWDEDDYNNPDITVLDVVVHIESLEFVPDISDLYVYVNTLGFEHAVKSSVKEIQTKINEQGESITRQEKLKYVHDYICNNATYSRYGGQSTDEFFIGDKELASDGYAKTFKALCDKLNIPCVCVSGTINKGNIKDYDDANMWNYVQMEDGKWYLIDVAMNDYGSEISYTYFLANKYDIATERQENYQVYITFPELSDVEYVPHTHIWKENGVLAKPATCVEKGEIIYKCSNSFCDGVKTEQIEIDKNAHNFTLKTTIPATHIAEGFEFFSCKCGDVYTKPISKLEGHTYKTEVTTPATHTSVGTITYTCECGDTYTEEIEKIADHSYVSEITTPATHMSDGVMTFTCECGDTYTEVINKIVAHDFKATVTEPTCTEHGYTTFTCECGETYTRDYTNALGHKYSSAVTAPTCTEDGYTIYICDCGDSYVADYVDATDHIDEDNDYICDNGCGYEYEKPEIETPEEPEPEEPDNNEEEKPCDCNCHKGGITGFFFKLINFFAKLFDKSARVCKCGAKH